MLDNIFEAIDESEDYISATIVGKYKEISEILNLVISCYAVEIGDISLCSQKSNGYKDEYALVIINDEDRGVVICCSPVKTDRGYCGYGGDVVYILENCNSKVQYACEDEAKFVIIGEEEFECEKCPCGCHKEEKEINPVSSYTINGKSVTKEEFDKKYAKIVNSYRENMRSTLLDYCSWMDEVNDILSRL
jgi:spore coat protein CotH